MTPTNPELPFTLESSGPTSITVDVRGVKYRIELRLAVASIREGQPGPTPAPAFDIEFQAIMRTTRIDP